MIYWIYIYDWMSLWYSSQHTDKEQTQWDGGLATRHWRTEKHLHQRGPKAVYTWFTSGQTFLHTMSVLNSLCAVCRMRHRDGTVDSVSIARWGLYCTGYSKSRLKPSVSLVSVKLSGKRMSADFHMLYILPIYEIIWVHSLFILVVELLPFSHQAFHWHHKHYEITVSPRALLLLWKVVTID